MPARTRFWILLLVVLLVGALIPTATADDAGRAAFDPYDILEPTHLSTAQDAEFGSPAATDGTLLVIGAPEQDSVIPNVIEVFETGVVYVFEEQPDGSWTYGYIQYPDPVFSYGEMGSALDVDAGRFVVGGYEPGSGRAFVYEPNGSGGWVETQLLRSEALNDGSNWYGREVAIEGNRIVVSAPTTLGGPYNDDSVFVFEKSGGIWTNTVKLEPSENDESSGFGFALDIEGDRIVVGHYLDEASTIGGRVYVYTWTGAAWEETVLEPPSPEPYQDFGANVAIDGDTIYVTAAERDQGGLDDAGAVFVFEWSGASWVHSEITPPGGHVADSWFGWTLKAADGYVLARSTESVFLFRRFGSGWVGEQVPEPSEVGDSDNWGAGTALGGGMVVVGAPAWNLAANGRSYVFRQCSGRVATLAGTPGGDVITGTPGDDVIEAGAGNDTVDAGAGDDVVCGGSGNDTLAGGNGADSLFGQGNVDFLAGGAGLDLLDGGASLSDWVSYLDSPAGVSVTLPVGTSPGSATGEGTDTLVDVENVRGSLFDDVIVGNPRDNRLFGYQGDDVIDGKAGDDTVDGGAGFDTLQGHKGDDTIVGGPGRDYAEFSEADGPVTVDLTAGTASYSGWNDTVSGVEHVRGSRWDDVLKGDDFGNILRGLPGDDTLNGMGGYDYLFGADGTDTAYPGAGGAKCFLVEAPNGCD